MKPSRLRFMPNPLWLYVIGWLFFLYLFIVLLSFTPSTPGSPVIAGLYFVNFGVHEASHIVFGFLPAIFVASAGSIGEIVFGGLLVAATIKARAYFATVFAGLWLMLSFVSAGVYMADARLQALPLIGPGENVQHDWHFVFSQLGWLEYDTMIGNGFKIVGIALGVASLLFGLWLMYEKVRRGHSAEALKKQ